MVEEPLPKTAKLRSKKVEVPYPSKTVLRFGSQRALNQAVPHERLNVRVVEYRKTLVSDLRQ